MNRGIFGLPVLMVSYGLLTGAFLCFLKSHFKSTRTGRGLFGLVLFTGFITLEIFLENGILSRGIYSVLMFLLFFGMVIFSFSGAFEKKLLAAAILMAGQMLLTGFCASLMSVLNLLLCRGLLKQPIVTFGVLQDALITIFTYVITAAVLCFLSKKSGSLWEEKTGKWYLMTAGPLFFIILFVEAYNWSVSRGVLFWGGENMGLYENQLFSYGAVCLCTAVCMFAAGFYVYGMDRIYREWQKKEQYRMQTVYLEGLREQNEKIDRIRHDMKNHVVSLQGLLADGSLEKLKEYLDRIAETGGIAGTEEITGSRAVDALLYEKRKRAEEGGVDWQCDMQPWKEGFLHEFDFCILAGNALDNAIEACESMEDECVRNGKAHDGIRIEDCGDMKDDGGGKQINKFIHIQTGWVKDYFLFEVKNSTGEKTAGKGKISAPGSGEGERHKGIGLLNIKETVEKYNGILNTECENDVFILSVLIPRDRI